MKVSQLCQHVGHETDFPKCTCPKCYSYMQTVQKGLYMATESEKNSSAGKIL